MSGRWPLPGASRRAAIGKETTAGEGAGVLVASIVKVAVNIDQKTRTLEDGRITGPHECRPWRRPGTMGQAPMPVRPQ